MIFLAEFLLTRNFVLRVEEDSELLLEFTNTKLTREHVYFIHFRDGFIGTSFASFIFFLPSSLKFEWADFPLLSLKPEEDFLRAHSRKREKRAEFCAPCDGF